MTDRKPRYPVGRQVFSQIRKGNFVYVDKTDYIYRLTQDYNFVFLSRPRRFGKTLLTDTMQCYFEGRKELFTGLALENLETEWEEHPVLRFDFGALKVETVAKLEESLIEMIKEYEEIYGKSPETKSIGVRLRGLIRRAYKQTGRSVVLLIDEYDSPLLEVLLKPDMIEGTRSVMREFYSQIKSNEEYLRFVFITGISTFSQLGMISELNNLTNITNWDEYAAICGITEQELKDNFDYGIRQYAEQEACSVEEAIEILREQYDGYHFTSSMVDVFNPYSLLNAFAGRKLDDYWFQTGTPKMVIDMLKEHKGEWELNIEDVEGLPPVSLSDFNTPLEQANDPIPFLYQTGYLTIKSYDKEFDSYVLGVPNTEVRIGLIKNLIPLYSSMNVREAANTAKNVSISLSKGDYDNALRFIQSFLAGIPFLPGDLDILANELKCEAYYHKIFYTIIAMLHNGARGQVRQALGMPDMVIETRKYIYIIEIKINSTPEVALEQLNKKQYAVPYFTEDKEIIKLGVNFSTETRTINEWKREE